MNEEHKKNDCLFYNDPESLLLESGQIINSHDIAYKTYGTLNSKKDNLNFVINDIKNGEYLMIKGSNSTGLSKISKRLKVGKINAF